MCIPPLRHAANRKKLTQETKEVDDEASKINTANISETNQLMYAGAKVESERPRIKLSSEKREDARITTCKKWLCNQVKDTKNDKSNTVALDQGQLENAK